MKHFLKSALGQKRIPAHGVTTFSGTHVATREAADLHVQLDRPINDLFVRHLVNVPGLPHAIDDKANESEVQP